MPTRRPRCPKCGGRLYRDQETGSRFALPSEWACLQCGWRRTYAPAEFERRFALTAAVPEPAEIAPACR
ncbi:MAG TPA: hypothetical protein VFA70_10645 [Dehalococcoidia bacterium]|jgi:RNase P subunit RPR2|nr:hypothetical protein [Dehalococcoidia bacterium]